MIARSSQKYDIVTRPPSVLLKTILGCASIHVRFAPFATAIVLRRTMVHWVNGCLLDQWPSVLNGGGRCRSPGPPTGATDVVRWLSADHDAVAALLLGGVERAIRSSDHVFNRYARAI